MAKRSQKTNPVDHVLSWKIALQAVVITLASFWVFWPARHGQWIGDDYLYLASNPLLHDPARLWKAWFQPGSFVEYYPIEQSVQWFQWLLWHDDTFGYHVTNIVLHVVSALLVWHLFDKLGLRLAWLGGLIFAVHPMMVDSVALANELKTVLSLPPFLLAMCFYLDFEQRGRRRDYGLALGLFTVAMLCKITMIMFPVVILLYAWWKRGRIGRRDLVASAPFFAVSLALGLLTVWAGHIYDQAHGAHTDDFGGPLFRFVLVGQIISFYFSRCFLPITPLPMYPRWSVDPASPWQYLPWPIMAGVFWFLWTKRSTWGRHALLGLGFFLIMLTPFWGAKWISYMIVTWVLEHLLYIPILGLIGLVIAGLDRIDHQLSRWRAISLAIVAVGIAWMALQSRTYAGKYINEETICTYTIEHYPGDWLAYNNLALSYVRKGQLDRAIAFYQQAAQINPTNSAIHGNLGNALVKQGRNDDAIFEYRKAIELNPNDDLAHYNLGNALFQKDLIQDSIASYQRALEINPTLAGVHGNLANAYLKWGHVDEAVAQMQEALRVEPNDFRTHNNLGAVLLQKGDIDGAEAQFQNAIDLSPNYAAAHYNLGNALLQKGRVEEAISQYQKALEINPNYAEAQNNLAKAQTLLRH